MSRRIVILILIIGVAGAVYFLMPSPETNETAETGESDSEMVQQSDTLADDRPSYEQTENLAPGTAKLQVEITTLDRSDDQVMITATAGRILGYGSATPPIAEGEELTINATGYSEVESNGVSDLEPGDRIVVLISHSSQPAIEGMQEEKQSWKLAKIVEEKQ